MSVSVTSFVVLGVKIPLPTVVAAFTKVETQRGCQHPIVSEQHKFCGECGAPLWREVREVPEFEEELREIARESALDVRVTYDHWGSSMALDGNGHAYVGLVLDTETGEDVGDGMDVDAVFLPHPSEDEIASLLERIQAFVEPLGLKGKTRFGLYSVAFKC